MSEATPDENRLSSRQRKYLRSQAHHLKPVVQIGKNGLGDTVFASLDEALEHHELIKVRFQDQKDEKKEACAAIEQRLDAEVVGMAGHVAIFFRQARDPENRKLKIPS